jgi:hypothetical protein
MSNNKIKIKLILSGSGIKGAYHYGFINKLKNNDKYIIEKIFSSSIGSLNALFLSKNNFNNFWENYENLLTKKSMNEIFPDISFIHDFFGKKKANINQNILNNILDEHIGEWYDCDIVTPFSISKKNQKKTEIFEINSDLKKNIPKNFLSKYIKDLILNTNIFNFHDSSYININNNYNEFVPIKSLISDIMYNDLNNDNEKYIYILLSLQSEESVINCFPSEINNDFVNDNEYMTNIYKYNLGNKNIQNFQEKHFFLFYGLPLFVFQIENAILIDYNDNKINEFILNCIDNGKYHFDIFNESVSQNFNDIFNDSVSQKPNDFFNSDVNFNKNTIDDQFE